MKFAQWKWNRTFILAAGFLLAGVSPCLSQPPSGSSLAEGPTLAELEQMPKIDVHAHFGTYADESGPQLIDLLNQHHMKWMVICWEGMEWKNLQRQITLAEQFHRDHPAQFSWATSFNLENWGDKDWTESAIGTIKQGFAQGAVAVKVWKEIGMELKDPDGHFVMIDDARFDPILDCIESQGKTLVAHIGEPRNCWLPKDQMDDGGDRYYYTANPRYYAYLHPEIPGYWEQIRARDHMLEKHPHLRVVGCHLGSLEFDVDELAKRLDKYPNFAVDMAARVRHLELQDREKVRTFIIKYQDRLLYGTDNEVGNIPPRLVKEVGVQSILNRFNEVYRRDYRYFSTNEELDLPQIRPNYKTRGLGLPFSVLRKIYYENALKWYPGI